MGGGSGQWVGSGVTRCLYNSNVDVLIALILFTALDPRNP